MRIESNYTFSRRHDEVVNYLRKVFDKSCDYYQRFVYAKNVSRDVGVDMKCIRDGVDALADYLYYYNSFYVAHFDEIFDTLKKKLKIITVLPPEKRGIYGQYEELMEMILINPELKKSKTLSSEERTKLYMYHELGHVINSKWVNNLYYYIVLTPVNDEMKKLMYDGFSLLDEVTTQNRAEDITYFFSKNDRPKLEKYIGKLYDGEPYISNFDFYGDMEEPAYYFARTLRGLGVIFDMDKSIDKLSDRTLDSNFLDKLFNEYERDGHLTELYYILAYMGIIKNASYAKFGYGDKKYISMSGQAKEELDKMTRPLRDYRKPYTY